MSAAGPPARAFSRIAQLAAGIFGNYLGSNAPSGRKLLTQQLRGPSVVAYFPSKLNPEAFSKFDDLLEQPAEEARLEKLERRRKQGRGAAKKGEGKRASAKK